MTPATALTNEILIAIGKRFPQIKLWRNSRVNAMAMGAGGKMRRISAGIDGQADLSGIIGQSTGGTDLGGRRIEVEIKAGADRMRPSQLSFKAMILRHNGVFIEARSVDQCLTDIESALKPTIAITAPDKVCKSCGAVIPTPRLVCECWGTR